LKEVCAVQEVSKQSCIVQLESELSLIGDKQLTLGETREG